MNVTLLALLVLVEPPLPTEAKLSLSVESAGCLDEATLRALIERESPIAGQADAAVTVQEAADGAVRLTLRAGETESMRELNLGAQTCERQQATVALSLALALEFFVAGQQSRPPAPEPDAAAAPEAEPEPEPEPEPAIATVPAPPVPPPTTRRWAVSAGGVVHSGIVVHPAVGGLVRIEHAWPRASVRLGAQWNVADRIALFPGRLRLHDAVAVPEGCVRWVRDVVALSACAGARVGALAARGLDFRRPRHALFFSVAPSVAGELRVPLSERLALDVGAFVAVPLRRPVFVGGATDLVAAPLFGGGTVDLTVLFGTR